MAEDREYPEPYVGFIGKYQQEEPSADEYQVEAQDELLMHNYTTLPDNCKKYWRKRYQLFSKFDEGVYMTSELWYSVTPESVAIFTAKLFKALLPEARQVLDICCGGGGNSIQFAEIFESVGAVDINEINEQCTRHNAAIYGVEDKLWSFIGDWNEISCPHDDGSVYMDWIPENLRKNPSNTTFDFIFASPPWGGPSYTKKSQEFDLYSMEPFPLDSFLSQVLQYSRNIGLFLPRNLNLEQISEVTREIFGDEAQCRVITVYNDTHPVGILALFGKDLTRDLDYDEIFGE
ncbi:uncharacterized protein CANTADRAFT_45772 [Suhomyces tanzawaensis NRRL Y-17324]|uniref:Trimethylguanosine synthase n=1 Tax=Suhomyces tanzawaensis NRRL Y-17324 TaxID=984487 RepID=A0A1E4SR85_9ASCO|nr:uncharacterized protein CANTADRAFT_45772 [Suhomyces tanzawaensis NRRL Y-17324]ODV82011.1 hypothetical protein CANTADRAFT_45772 [Suhomyces tanzawaensis NRRL Y-17324]